MPPSMAQTARRRVTSVSTTIKPAEERSRPSALRSQRLQPEGHESSRRGSLNPVQCWRARATCSSSDNTSNGGGLVPSTQLRGRTNFASTILARTGTASPKRSKMS